MDTRRLRYWAATLLALAAAVFGGGYALTLEGPGSATPVALFVGIGVVGVAFLSRSNRLISVALALLAVFTAVLGVSYYLAEPTLSLLVGGYGLASLISAVRAYQYHRAAT